MKIARFFIRNSSTWLDLPLADGQDTRMIMTTMKTEGYILCDNWVLREDAWSFIAILDMSIPVGGTVPGGRVLPFGVVSPGPPAS